MGALIMSVFLASLLGSVHCAGMCGAFVAFAVGIDEPNAARRRKLLHGAYNAGRLVTYCTLGAAAGAVGGALNLAGSMVGVSRVAAALAGAILVVFGGVHLLRAVGVRIAVVRPPRAMQDALRAANRAAMSLPPVRRAALIGLMTTLLPCGWLYAFVAAAAGTGSALAGAVTMAAFWAGTLPILVAVGAGVRAISGPLAKRLPVLMPFLVIGAGLLTIFSRLGVSADALRGVGAQVQAASLEESVAKLRALDADALPCCAPDAAGALGAPDESDAPGASPGAPPAPAATLAGGAATEAACACEHCATGLGCEGCACCEETADDGR